MKHYDLIVVGGGISGVAAAVSAAREGLSVLLIEKYGALGGAMSQAQVYPFMGSTLKGSNPPVYLSRGLFIEMKQRRAKYNDPSPEVFKFVFDDMVCEAGVDVLFHTTLFASECEGRRIKSVKATSRGRELELTADYFIDATGDGELIYMTGCEHTVGRESDGYCQPMTTCFRIAGVDVDAFYEKEKYLNEKYREYQAAGKISNPRENLLFFRGLGEGVLHMNTTRVIKHDPTDPTELTRAEMIARRQVYEMLEFFREAAPEVFKHASLAHIACHIGIRESRKLVGEHVLTSEELISCADFPDTVALGCYDVDIHNPTGSGTYIHTFKNGEYYKIPYRSLLPKEYDNMLVAGRCLSADHMAHSAVRILPICACLGEAAGAAIAVCKSSGTNTHTINTDTLRDLLVKKGAAV